jgi:hypothetical protein
MIVYANGCSFGLPPGPGTISYSQIISEKLDAQLINKHTEGTGNRRLIRSSLRDLIELKKQSNEKILALLGLSFFFRTELWQPHLPAVSNDGHFHPVRSSRVVRTSKSQYYSGDIDQESKNIDPMVRDWFRQQLIWQNKESLITEQVTDIIMFGTFCQQQGIDYLIWNNADIWPGHPEVNIHDVFLKDFVEFALHNVNLIDPWQFAFLPWALEQGLEPIDKDQYGDYGHPGQEAHKRLAFFLSEKIKEIR